MVYHRSREESSQDGTEPKNFFRNDGSFLEMFKKLQNSTASTTSISSPSNSSSDHSPTSSPSLPLANKEPTPSPSPVSVAKPSEKLATEREGKTTLNNKFPIVGKRRGGRALPTGQVKKLKTEPKEEVVEEPKDAWSQYLAEVKKYKETTCEEEGKTRPLVK